MKSIPYYISQMLTSIMLVLASSSLFAVSVDDKPEHPKRLVSMNLCTDVFAITLAEPEQIQALTFLAKNPEESPVAELAAAYPNVTNSTESVVLSQPDLVLAGPYSDPFVLDQLQQMDYPIYQLPVIDSLDALTEAYLDFAALIGQSSKATTQMQALASVITEITHTQSDALPELTYLTYGTGGYTSAQPSFQSDILARLGLRNMAADLGLAFGGYVNFEALLINPPDVFILPQYYEEASSWRAELSSHPALLHAMQGKLVIREPSALWRCFTPQITTYLPMLAAEVASYRATLAADAAQNPAQSDLAKSSIDGLAP